MANPLGRARPDSDKAFSQAVRMVVLSDDPVTGKRKLRMIAEKLVELAVAGESWAIQQVGDRLDGKPAQEATVTLHDKRDATDWTREELVAFLNDCRAGSGGNAHTNGRAVEPDKLH